MSRPWLVTGAHGQLGTALCAHLAAAGWMLLAPDSFVHAIGPVGGEVLILTELQVREDGWTLFGFGSADTNFRILPSENPNVGNVVSLLNDPDTPLLTISGTAPVFNEYANINFNDHWVKDARG